MATTKEMLKGLRGPSLGLVVYDPTTHQQAGLQANKVFYAASLAKLPIILWTLQQVRQGQVTWESTFPYTDKANAIAGAMVTGGTGSLQFEAYPGKTYSVRDLMDRTIRESDNQAANLLSYYLGESQADAYYRFRRQFDQKAEKFFHKSMTAQVAMRYMLALSKEKELADPFQHSLWAKDKIGCLPYPVWHKIGVNGQYNHDAAYVQADRPYILVVMTEGWSDERIAQLAQAIDHVLQEKD